MSTGILPLITCLWFLGVILFSIRMAGGFYTIQKIRKQSDLPVPQKLIDMVSEQVKKLGIKESVLVKVSERISGPLTIGILRPTIVIPISLLMGLDARQLEAIIFHELVHIKMKDYLLNILQSLISVLLFYHPGIWWLSRLIRQEREHRCDDWVINHLDNRLGYAKALTFIQEQFIHSQPTLAMSAINDEGTLTKRIKRMFGLSPITARNYLGIIVGTLIFCVGLLSFTTIKVQNNAQDDINTLSETNEVTPLFVNTETPQSSVPDKNIKESQRLQENANGGLGPTESLESTPKVRKDDKVHALKALPSTLKLIRENRSFVKPQEIQIQRQDDIFIGDSTKESSKVALGGDENKPPIFILDGERVTRNNLAELDPDKIHSIEVFKGEKAIEQFGPEAIDGVVVIYTKSKPKKTKEKRKEKKKIKEAKVEIKEKKKEEKEEMKEFKESKEEIGEAGRGDRKKCKSCSIREPRVPSLS